MKRIYVKKNKITQHDMTYLLNCILCKEHKKTLSFYPGDYHLLKISGYFKD
jgi:hypothetical protein